MGQKVNPIGYRLAVNRDWRSRWFREMSVDELHGHRPFAHSGGTSLC